MSNILTRFIVKQQAKAKQYKTECLRYRGVTYKKWQKLVWPINVIDGRPAPHAGVCVASTIAPAPVYLTRRAVCNT